jgi:2-hydroxychromene-2-carboxylate isomerase
MTASRLEFFYDLSSPWTYIAFTNLAGVEERTGEVAILRPVLVGGIFNAVNKGVYAAREAADNPKFIHSFRVLKDWAALAGLKLNFPSQYHPAKSIAAMRMACALENDQAALRRFTKAAFESYFLRAENLDDPEVLIAAADGVGLDGQAIAASSVSDENKAKLRANTDEAIARGAYGSPSIFIDQKYMYFGNDQLPLVEARLSRKI